MPVQTVYTKEFAPTLAGERVGWASAVELPDTDGLIAVDIVAATVGPEGAKQGYHPHIDNGQEKRLYSRNSSTGFLAIASMHAVVSHRDGVNVHTTDLQAERLRGGLSDGSLLLLNGAGGRPEHIPADELKSWVENGDDLLALFRSILNEHDIASAYPALYYLFNGKIAHKDGIEGTTLTNYPVESLLLPDGTMAQTTQAEIRAAQKLALQLISIQAEDRKMDNRLTAFGDTRAADIPDKFMESRRAVATSENAVQDIVTEMTASPLVYLPVGHRRSWPYMDASVKDERVAFGKELEALRAGDTKLTATQLERELNETDYRLKFAQHGVSALSTLYQLEKQKAQKKAS